MRLLIVAGILMAASAAQADGIWSVQLNLGFSGDSESDEFKSKQFDSDDIDNEDLEGNYGLAGAYEFLMTNRITLGPRLGFFVSEIDNKAEDKLNTLDIGAYARFFFNDGAWRGFVGAAIGPTFAQIANDDDDDERDLSGFGGHFYGNVGVQGDLGSTVGFIASLGALYQSVGSMEGDYKSGGQELDDAELKDSVATRGVLSAGITF